MSQFTVERIELTTLAEVGEFLYQEWAAFDRELLGLDDAVRWAKKRHLLRAVWGQCGPCCAKPRREKTV